MAGSQIICLVTGIALNVSLKRFYPAIHEQPLPIRLLYRVALLAIPVVTGYYLVTKPSRDKLNVLLASMHRRLVNLGINGDI